MKENLSLFGDNLKKIRKEKNLSLAEASKATNVSVTMLSQIERNDSIPTLTTVWKICNGLKINFRDLVCVDDTQNVIKNIFNLTSLTQDNDAEIYNLYSFNPVDSVDVFYGIFHPGCHLVSVGHRMAGKERIIVLEGELTISAEEKQYHLTANDFFGFNAQGEHHYDNFGSTDAKALLILI